MTIEIWKDLPSNNSYQISNLGRVKSKQRIVTVHRSNYREGYYTYELPDKIMSTQIRAKYFCVTLCKDGVHSNHLVHRLVAETFLSDYSYNLEVNHKNEDKLDNRFSNLEMCTRQYNKNYGTGAARSGKSRGKVILQFDMNNNFIREWDSLHQVARELNISLKQIWQACNNKCKTAKKYIWRYKNVE